MSFREKTAWITIVAIVVVSLMYWFHVGNPFKPSGGIWVLHSLAASLIVYLLIELIGWAVLRWRHPRDAREPRDERERLIDLKAIRFAYYTFAVSAFAGVFVTLHVVDSGPVAVATMVLMAFVLSQLAKHFVRIAAYRRDA